LCPDLISGTIPLKPIKGTLMGSDLASLTVWKLLALGQDELEQVDVVAANLAVAREIPALSRLHIPNYVEIVDDWTRRFAQSLPQMERVFEQTPWRWKSDIRFFRVGMLQGFLGHDIGLQYIEEYKHATAIGYTDPSDLFINGLIDKKQGTCANMAALHVAMSRKMGWPVSLAVAKSHQLSRFDDGHVIHNIEATATHPGSFCSEDDSFYIKKCGLPKRAIECGSDLRKLTVREMLGVFLALAGRHYMDTDQVEAADAVYPLSRTLFPRYRHAYIAAMLPALNRGKQLFDPDELGHPNSLFEDLAPTLAPQIYHPWIGQPKMSVEFVHPPILMKTSTPTVFSLGKIDPQRMK
jgi:hypothetical protein